MLLIVGKGVDRGWHADPTADMLYDVETVVFVPFDDVVETISRVHSKSVRFRVQMVVWPGVTRKWIGMRRGW